MVEPDHFLLALCTPMVRRYYSDTDVSFPNFIGYNGLKSHFGPFVLLRNMNLLFYSHLMRVCMETVTPFIIRI